MIEKYNFAIFDIFLQSLGSGCGDAGLLTLAMACARPVRTGKAANILMYDFAAAADSMAFGGSCGVDPQSWVDESASFFGSPAARMARASASPSPSPSPAGLPHANISQVIDWKRIFSVIPAKAGIQNVSAEGLIRLGSRLSRWRDQR